MSTKNNANCDLRMGLNGQPPRGQRHHAVVTLNDEQLAAVEGWRIAQGIPAQSDALGELVRLGLLSEIAKIFRLVSENRAPPSGSQGKNATGKADKDNHAEW